MTSAGGFAQIELRNKVAVLTLRRTAILNAVDMAFAREILGAATYLAGHSHIRVVVVRGEGRAFCTGLDLKALSAGRLPFEYFDVWERALRTFETMDKVVVVGMHGYALGGGLQLALAADVRASTASCILGLPAVKESLVPGLGAWRLPRVIGFGRGRELIVSGRDIDGAEAHAIGLVDYVVADPLADVDALAEKLVTTCSQGTIASKLLMAEFDRPEYERALRAHLYAQFACYGGPDAMEARRAYQSKEQPQWL